MNREKARFNMVEQQIRPWNVLDSKVLNLMATLPRELFVDTEYRPFAFADMQLPLEHHQIMFAPREEARMLQALKVGAKDKVLEVGTGSGFVTALLASQAKQVYSLDIYPDFVSGAHKKLMQLNIRNTHFEEADATTGWSHMAPYQVIAVTAALLHEPTHFIEQLAPGGRLFWVHKQENACIAKVYTKTANEQLEQRIEFEMNLPLLENSATEKAFVF